MPAAENKQDLLDVSVKDFDKLHQLLTELDEKTALAKDGDDTSIKDVVAHRAHWIGLFLGWYHDGLAGNQVYFPAKGYKWSDLKRYNAEVRVAQANVGWADACAQLTQAHADLIEFLECHSDKDLYSGPMVGANNKWTPGRWAEAAGPSHYRSAAKYVRSRIRALA